MESGTHVALSRNRHCGRKASLGGHGDYTQADSQWENNRYKVTIHGCLKLCGGGWSRMHGSAAATVCFQCTFTTPKGNPTSLKQPPPPFFPPSHGPICLPAVSVLDGSATWHHTQLGPSLSGLSLKSSKRQHASTCPPLSSGGTGPRTTFNLLSLYHFSSPTVSPGRPRIMACGWCSETPVGCTSGSGRGGSHLGDMVTSPSYLKPVQAEEFPQPVPKVQGRPGCGDRASLSICTHGTAFALGRCGGWLLLVLFILPLLVVDVPCVVVIPNHCEVLQEPAHPLGGSHLGSASDGLEGRGRICT